MKQLISKYTIRYIDIDEKNLKIIYHLIEQTTITESFITSVELEKKYNYLKNILEIEVD